MGLNINFIKRMHLEDKNKNYVYVRAKRGPSKTIKLPLKLNQDLACLVGIIIGDGNLKKDKQRVTIELIDKDLMEKIQKLIFILFNKKTILYTRLDKRPNRKPRYCMNINNAAIYDLLNQTFEIPKGNKCRIVRIPKVIKEGKLNEKKAFIIGLFSADGGRRHGKGVGLSTSSKTLRRELSNLLKELKIIHKKDEWVNKKYKKRYFGLYFTRENLKSLMWECRSGQTGQILDSLIKKLEGQA